MKTLFQVLASLTLLESGVAQRTWVVNCAGGPRADFTNLPPAVAAATPGDRILVVYDGGCPNGAFVAAPRIDKAITIMGVTSVWPVGTTVPPLIAVKGEIMITGLPAGSRVVLANLSIVADSSGVTPVPAHGLHLVDCAGEVYIDYVRYFGGGRSSSIMRVDRCANVTLRACDLTLSGEGLTVVDSNVTLLDTFVGWGGPHFDPTLRYTTTGPALQVHTSNVRALGCMFLGASQIGSLTGQYARCAADVASGALDIGPETLLSGGWNGGSGGSWQAASLAMGAGASVRRDPRADPLYQSPTVVAATLDMAWHDFVIAGETYCSGVYGPPRGFALMAVGMPLSQSVSLPMGALAMDPATISVLGIAPLAASDGYADWWRQCPLQVPVGEALVFQAATLSPSGQIGLTSPSKLVISWPNAVVP
jgi:hypothetical protein